MNLDLLKVNTRLSILYPIAKVFESIINPDKMSQYFISSGSGKMIE